MADRCYACEARRQLCAQISCHDGSIADFRFPWDFTAEDAERVYRVVRALAVPPSPSSDTKEGA